jgi:hypothetical protein
LNHATDLATKRFFGKVLKVAASIMLEWLPHLAEMPAQFLIKCLALTLWNESYMIFAVAGRVA